jgi:hypothetical protein
MTNEQQLARLRNAYRQMVHAYAPHLTTAATLTLKLHARIRVRRFENVGDEYFEFCQKLNDEIIDSTVRRFTARLTRHLFGNHALHANKQHWAKPLIIVAIEGRKRGKRPHLHIALGNVPLDKQDRIGYLIETAWHECDFGNEQIRVEPLTSASGWLDYMTKEVEFRDADVVAVQHASIPEIIQRSI